MFLKNDLLKKSISHIRLFSIGIYLVLLSGFALAQSFPAAPSTVIDPHIGVESLVAVYPDMLAKSGFDTDRNDWFCETHGGRRFYWQNGCLLTSETDTTKKHKPYISYMYPDNVLDPSTFTKEIIEHLQSPEFLEHRENGGELDQTFYAILFGGSASRGMRRAFIEGNNRKTQFLGRRITVNKRLIAPLRLVEADIRKAAQKDADVQNFINTLESIGGYNWRIIADSGAVSNHSWGMAIDFLPKRWGSKIIYWYWEQKRNKNWMLVPPEERWAPPAAVIAAFENNGFIWGGKWLVWDNMHFEYRPELHEIKRRIASLHSQLQNHD